MLVNFFSRIWGLQVLDLWEHWQKTPKMQIKIMALSTMVESHILNQILYWTIVWIFVVLSELSDQYLPKVLMHFRSFPDYKLWRHQTEHHRREDQFFLAIRFLNNSLIQNVISYLLMNEAFCVFVLQLLHLKCSIYSSSSVK